MAAASVPFGLTLGGAAGRAVEIRIPGEVNAAAGNETVFNAEIVNRGALGASSLELEWSAGGDGGRVPVALPQPPASGIYVETKVWGDGRRTSRKVAR